MRSTLPVFRNAWVRSCFSTLISLMPIWLRPAADHPFLRAFVPVSITYAAAAVGGAYLDQPATTEAAETVANAWKAGDIVGLWVGAVAIAIGHLAIPLVVYFAYVIHDPRAKTNALYGCLLYLYTSAWFGAPIIALAALTGWLSLAAAAVHLALAGQRERHWVFVEYGSASFALLLLFVLHLGDLFIPCGLPIVAIQSLLLTVVAVWGRKLVLDDDSSTGRRREKRDRVSKNTALDAPLSDVRSTTRSKSRRRKRGGRNRR